jgi:hypothetical protein
MDLSHLNPIAEAALLTAVLRKFLTEQGRDGILLSLQGIRVTQTAYTILLTSPIAKAEIAGLIPQLISLFQSLGYDKSIKTRLVQWVS